MDLLRRLVVHNFALKLIALVAAVVLWWAVSKDPTIEVSFNVPIEFHNVPEELELAAEAAPQMQIRVRGPQRRVRELTQADVRPVVDLAGSQPGERTYDLTTANISVPGGIEVVQVTPSRLRLQFDRRATRELEVRPRVVGNFPDGYALQKVVADPPRITVVGPEKHIAALDAAMTDPVDATGVMGQQTFTTNAYVADALVREVRPTPIRVTVITANIKKDR